MSILLQYNQAYYHKGEVMAKKKSRFQLIICAEKKLKPKTAEALVKAAEAIYRIYARRCIDRGTHIACGRR